MTLGLVLSDPIWSYQFCKTQKDPPQKKSPCFKRPNEIKRPTEIKKPTEIKSPIDKKQFLGPRERPRGQKEAFFISRRSAAYCDLN